MGRHTQMANKIFIEIGFDLDNNRFGFGRSVEIEHDDGTEDRMKKRLKLKQVESHYVRIWLGKRVLVLDRQKPHLAVKKKTRNNFKGVVGKWGYQ